MATGHVQEPSQALEGVNVEPKDIGQSQDQQFAALELILKELQQFLPDPCLDDAYTWVNSANPGNIRAALSFFRRLLDHLKSEKEKSEKGPEEFQKTTGCSAVASRKKPSPSYWPFLPKTVMVYSLVTGQTFGAHNVILEYVTNVGWTTSATTKIETTGNPMEAHIVIVFCPITSRVGSDVDIAMRKVTETMGQRRVLLVLLHHTRDKDFSTNKTNWSQEFPNVVSSIDVLFHETQNGLLNCQLNERAMGQIQKILLKQYR